MRVKFLDMYGRKCQCCNETIVEFLTLDHIQNDGNTKRKTGEHGGSQAYRAAVKEYQPHLYRVLCMQCNWARGQYGECPHKRKQQKSGSGNGK